MRTLLILRHGKSDWNAAFGDDEQRPLAKRGQEAAAKIGRFIVEFGAAPDLAITSPAIRAAETLEIARTAGQWEASVKEDRTLYVGSVAGILEMIRSTSPDHKTLLLAGHQPTSANLVATLIGGGRLRFPTAAVACVQFQSTWNDIGPGTGELAWFVIPRSLP